MKEKKQIREIIRFFFQFLLTDKEPFCLEFASALIHFINYSIIVMRVAPLSIWWCAYVKRKDAKSKQSCET
jgi:hypothetical protein